MSYKYSFIIRSKKSNGQDKDVCSFISELEDTHSTELFKIDDRYIFRQTDYSFIVEFFRKKYGFVLLNTKITKSDIADLFLACDDIITLYYRMSRARTYTSTYRGFKLTLNMRSLEFNYDAFAKQASAMLPLNISDTHQNGIFYYFNKELSDFDAFHQRDKIYYGDNEKCYGYGYFVDVSNVKKYLKKVLMSFNEIGDNEYMVLNIASVNNIKPKFTKVSYTENDMMNFTRDYIS